MKWFAKAAAYKILSALPGGPALYDFSRLYITKSLEPTADRVSQKMAVGMQYFEWLQQHGARDRFLKGVHLDFGAGWHPTIPLLFYSLGVDRQRLLDVTPFLRARTIRQTLATFMAVVSDPGWPHRAKLCRMPPPFRKGKEREYLERLGVDYQAPYVKTIASLAGTVDVVTCTQVFPYVPRQAVPQCFREIRDTLKQGGLLLATAYVKGILLGLGPGLTKYRQLRFSTTTWERWINSPLMSFNRFKGPDYRELLERAGFEIVHFEVEPGTPEEVRELDHVPIHPCFQRYSREDLAAHNLFFVARKP